MGITIVTLNDGASEEMWTADRHLYKTRDGRVVEEGHPESRFLYATPGYLIPLREAQQYGLAPIPQAPSKVEVKMRERAQDKQRRLRDKQQAEREALIAHQAEERLKTEAEEASKRPAVKGVDPVEQDA
jgi:hypothetical protein